MTLTEFLKARLDEDEQRAQRAAGQWDDEDVRYEWEDLPDDVFAHARTQSPARVLAEVEAKRRIVDDYSTTIRIRDEAAARIKNGDLANAAPADLDTWDRAQREAGILEGPVKALALPYADHPDYDESWRP